MVIEYGWIPTVQYKLSYCLHNSKAVFVSLKFPPMHESHGAIESNEYTGDNHLFYTAFLCTFKHQIKIIDVLLFTTVDSSEDGICEIWSLKIKYFQNDKLLNGRESSVFVFKYNINEF